MVKRQTAEIKEWIRKSRYEDDEKTRHLLLDMWIVLENKIQELESVRDLNAPENYSDECKKVFADAVLILPELKRYAKEIWYEYAGKEVTKIE